MAAPSPDYWLREQSTPRHASWSGYAFENLVYQHINDILAALELRVVALSTSTWKYQAKPNSDEHGAQIDLIIDRADNCINLCEIRFRQEPLVITKAYAQTLKDKKAIFREQTKTKKSLITTLITNQGVKENENYFSAVDNHISLEEYWG